MTNHARAVWRRLALPLGAVFVAAGVACHGDITNALLTATDPDLINPGNVQTPDGATALRIGALGRLRDVAGGSAGEGSTWLFGGLLTDEWMTSSTFIQNDETDERKVSVDNSTVLTMYRNLNRTRTAANQAIAAMKQFLPTQSSNIAELYFARGFAEMQLAQDFCNGIPLSDGASDTPTFGTPLSNAQVFAVANASYDSALALATGTDAFSQSVANATRIAKARSLMALNDYAGAAALVAAIPTTYSYDETYATTSGDITLWAQPFSSRRYTVGDTVVVASGTKFIVKPAIPFASAKDPRIPAANSPAGTKGQDGSVTSWTTTIWDRSTSVALVNGIDARLIEAENFLKKGDVTNWLATLNALRAAPPKLGTVQPTAAQLPPLVDPGTTQARVDLQFYEKAFWTFARGQRLSDIRRLIRQYGRDQATLLPGGSHYRGVPYGNDVNLPVPFNETVNPNFLKCTDRSA